jgi:ribosomal-protein-serine acetyltransferase
MPEQIVVAGDLVLHRYQRDDTQAVLDLVLKNFDDLHLWMPWAQQRPTFDDEDGFVQLTQSRWDERAEYNFRIEFAGAFVGSLGTWPVEHDPENYELGYWLDRDARGRGICTRSVLALVDTTHDAFGISHFSIRCDQANEPSQAVARRAGFAVESTERRQPIAAGESGVMLTFSRRHD